MALASGYDKIYSYPKTGFSTGSQSCSLNGTKFLKFNLHTKIGYSGNKQNVNIQYLPKYTLKLIVFYYEKWLNSIYEIECTIHLCKCLVAWVKKNFNCKTFWWALTWRSAFSFAVIPACYPGQNSQCAMLKHKSQKETTYSSWLSGHFWYVLIKISVHNFFALIHCKPSRNLKINKSPYKKIN